MRFHADLHVHSKYSRATSRDLDLEHLAWWGARKGLRVVATGDFCHPAWNAELKDKLVPAEPGLFRLRDDIAQGVAARLPAACRRLPSFMLSVEISTIYKKGEKTRKIHHLLYAPDFATVDRIAASLGRIGNIASDGRPILGLDSRHLLEIALESGPGAYLIPAHIWTPWFAALGSQSGFDSIAECYGDLADRIFAVETGLSSDPAMNWRVSFLDRYRLTSSSDAHSPGKLGREATAFAGEPDYFAIRHALETGEGYVGTVEFFPEEGKYHMDGHRKCHTRLDPKETLALGGRCPVCGQPVTVGVAHRVEVLADRSEAEAAPPATAGIAENLVPLPEVLSEIAGTGPASKAVGQSYDRLVAALGPELSILSDAPVEDIARADTRLAEAVRRLRAGSVIREAGYDGEYGRIRLFEEAELKQITGGGLLFDAPAVRRRKAAKPAPATAEGHAGPEDPAPLLSPPLLAGGAEPVPEGMLAGLDPDQRAAVAAVAGPVLVVAGPGSGKTRVLVHRIAHLVAERGVPPGQCLAITFTRRAAGEMRERLAHLLPAAAAAAVPVHTFHSLGLAILREQGAAVGLHRGFAVADEAERIALLSEALGCSERKAASLVARISRAKRTREVVEGDLAAAMAVHARIFDERNKIDFDDLVGLMADALADDPGVRALYRDRFRHVAVDEFQDLDEQQYRLLRLLVPPDGNVCAIGDPDQAIYGFRGADAACFERFAADFPGAATIRLRRNYRSSGTIVAASAQVIGAGATAADRVAGEGPRGEGPRGEGPGGEGPGGEGPMAVRPMLEPVGLHVAAGEAAEAEQAVAMIERLIGGHSFFSIDSGRAAARPGDAGRQLGFADFAVLYRTDAQAAAFAEALARAGMPFARSSPAPIADRPAVRALLRAVDAQTGEEASLPLPERLAAARPADEGLDAAAVAEARGWLAVLAGDAGRADAGGDRARLLEAVALATEADFLDPRADRISLLTMHAAKGLEFPVVLVAGVEDGLVPLSWGTIDPATAAEERRLFYVAMTRARDVLVLSRAQQRRSRGQLRRPDPSPFLADIDASLLREERPASAGRPPERQLSLF